MSHIYNIASIIATGLALGLAISYAGHHAFGWDWLGLIAGPVTAMWLQAERRRHTNRQVSTLNPLTSSVAGWTVQDEEAST